MKFILPLLLVLIGCGCAHASHQAHLNRGIVKCTGTLENCSKIAHTMCEHIDLPMMAEGPSDSGEFTVTFDCLDK